MCTPGILRKSRSRGLDIAYNFNNGGLVRPQGNHLEGRPGELESLEALVVKLKAPILNGSRFKMVAGFNYEPEKFFFSSVPTGLSVSALSPNVGDVYQQIDARMLKHTSLSLFGVSILDEQHYLGFRAQASFNGDYRGLINFDNRYASYQASLALGIKRTSDFEWGFGLNFSHDSRRSIVLPFILYNRNFNRKWGLEAVFPASVQGRYNIDKRSILLFGYEYGSRFYSIDVQNPYLRSTDAYLFSHSELRFGVSLERQIVPWVWLNMKAGYQINMPNRFQVQGTQDLSYRATPGNAPYFRLGFFLSPPDKYYR